MNKIAILGTGAYGLSLTSLLTDNEKNDITIWTRFTKEQENLLNSNKLEENNISRRPIVTTDLEEAIKNKDLIIIAIPSNFVKDLLIEMKPYIDNTNILIATKGLDNGKYLSDHVKEVLNIKTLGVISGGSFAKDIVTKNIFGLTLATESDEFKELATDIFNVDYLNLDYTTDIEGVQFCGTFKNIIAITSGLLEGKNMPESTRKYYLYKTIKELQNILEKLGNNDTLISSAGICDLLLTATTKDSRNYTFGTLLGQDKEKAKEYLDNTTVEGIDNLKDIINLLEKKNIKSQLLININNVIYEDENYETLLK